MTARWLKVSDVADQLGFTPRTILTWIDRGDLQACRLPNGRLRIPQGAVDELLSTGMTSPGKGTPESWIAMIECRGQEQEERDA